LQNIVIFLVVIIYYIEYIVFISVFVMLISPDPKKKYNLFQIVVTKLIVLLLLIFFVFCLYTRNCFMAILIYLCFTTYFNTFINIFIPITFVFSRIDMFRLTKNEYLINGESYNLNDFLFKLNHKRIKQFIPGTLTIYSDSTNTIFNTGHTIVIFTTVKNEKYKNVLIFHLVEEIENGIVYNKIIWDFRENLNYKYKELKDLYICFEEIIPNYTFTTNIYFLNGIAKYCNFSSCYHLLYRIYCFYTISNIFPNVLWKKYFYIFEEFINYKHKRITQELMVWVTSLFLWYNNPKVYIVDERISGIIISLFSLFWFSIMYKDIIRYNSKLRKIIIRIKENKFVKNDIIKLFEL